MFDEGYGMNGRSDFVGGLMGLLCESIPFIFSNAQSDRGSIDRVESTAREFHDQFMAVDDAVKIEIADIMTDVFIRDSIDAKELLVKFKELGHCGGIEPLLSQINYEISLPPVHNKAFLRKKVQCSFENLSSVYDSFGTSMIEIADEESYAKALISHMVLYRSLCEYENVLDKLKKKRVESDDVYDDIFQVAIAIFRVYALVSDRYPIEEMQSTYSKMLSGEPLFRVFGEGGEIII